ncbi:hypothetical protein JCM1840_005613 [Sporobolomyces johnsonii]
MQRRASTSSAPWISDQYKADPFPLPRHTIPSLTLTPGRRSSSPSSHHGQANAALQISLESSPPASPISSTSSTSAASAPPAEHRPFHLHDKSHPAWLTSQIHKLEINFSKTQRAMEESKAEEVHRFPDASSALRMKPLLENSRKKLHVAMYSDMTQVAVSGDLLAVGAGVRVEVWSARQARAAFCEIGMHGIGTEVVTSVAWSESGRYLWVGCDDGSLFEFDAADMYTTPWYTNPFKLAAHRRDAHPHHPVIKIFRVGPQMYTLDESGRLVVWLPAPKEGRLSSLHGHSKILQIPKRPTWSQELNGLLYVTYRLKPAKGRRTAKSRLQVYDVHGLEAVLLGEREWEEHAPGQPGRVTCACIVPSHREFIFMGHDSGHVSIWQPERAQLLEVRKVSLAGVSAMVGPSRFLWLGYSSGMIDVVDIADPECWRVIKRWRAHATQVEVLVLDPRSLWSASQLRVVSSGGDLYVRFWDGLLRRDWITERMSQNVESYCDFQPLKIGIFTWNVDGANPDELNTTGPVNKNLLGSFLTSLDEPDLFTFNFQELIDLSDLTLAARTVLFATKNHDVTGRYRHWHAVLCEAVAKHLGADYEYVDEVKLVGLYTIMFARKSVKHKIRDVAPCRIKNGFDAEYGNKGSVMLRLVIEDSSFCFINSHLSSGKSHPAERERDLIEIFDSGPKFPRSSSCTRLAYVGGGDGTQISDCEIVFFSGDLNFRIDLPREQVLSTLAHSPTAVHDLLPHDELTRALSNPSFRLRKEKEAPIFFPPTWKYDHFSSTYDSSSKQRTPSWTDRILWRSSEREESVKALSYGRYEADISDHRPVSASFEVEAKKIDMVREEAAYRDAVHDWAGVEEGLLQTARTYYPPGI